MSDKFKKALRIAVNVGCGFEGDAEDAAELLSLIETNEARIAELEAEVTELKPYLDGYDADKQLPEEGKVVIASFADMLLLASLSGGRWYDAIKPHQRIRGVDRWWKLPEVQE